MDDMLLHYGVGHLGGGNSGRYPWGSGDDPYQHFGGYTNYEKLKSKGFNEKELASAFGMTVKEFRQQRSIAKDRQLLYTAQRIQKLKDHGYKNTTIGKMMSDYNFGKPMAESTVRSYLDKTKIERAEKTEKIADILKKEISSKRYIDVGKGVEHELGVSREKLDSAIRILQNEGYSFFPQLQTPQVTNPRQKTTIMTLCDKDVKFDDVIKNMNNIKSVSDYTSTDGGKTWNKVEYPSSIDASRVKIRYFEDGGVKKDGVIELRPGVKDLTLGNSHYAQVRIMVNNSHYLKGMALYSNDVPDGYDIVFNTNKHKGTPKLDVLKELKKDKNTGEIDKSNPFGALVMAKGQTHYISDNGETRLSAVNKIKMEGDWADYSKSVASQMLSKQPVELISRQLNLAYETKEDLYNDILNVNNSAIRKKLLQNFAEGCDKSAVDLKAAAFPRQTTKVILPLPSLKDNEVYAPGYKQGETVSLVRYPHAGIFEIPQLKVNNKSQEGRKWLGTDTIDAIGVNEKTASQLSGADFDGDTVLVIPTNKKVPIQSKSPIKSLVDFEPVEAYPGYKGMPELSEQRKQMEMGKISNLITDITIKGCSEDDMTRAVKYSMVIIDAKKHKLDWQKAKQELGIDAMAKRYNGVNSNGTPKGASTLISRASGEVRVNERKLRTKIDKNTGEKIYLETGRSYIDKNGKSVAAVQKSTKMEETKNAYTLSSGTVKENIYADYANKLKKLANEARLQSINVKSTPVNAQSKALYSKEIDSLQAKLNKSLANAPKERQATLVARSIIKAKVEANPDLKYDKDQYGKIKQMAMETARTRVGANSKGTKVIPTDKEWEAIKANALNSTQLTKILNKMNDDELMEMVLPKTTSHIITDAKKARIMAYVKSGHTIDEIAKALGLSSSTVSNIIRSERGV